MAFTWMEIVVLASAGLAAFFGIWRLACKKWTVPWPSWLAWWLENPYFKVFCNPDLIAQRSGARDGMKILEIGCGAGRITMAIARLCGDRAEIIGMDVQDSMLEKMRRNVERHRFESIRPVKQDVLEAVELPSDVDRIVMVTVFGEIPKHDLLMQRLKAALKPGGVLSVTELLPDPCYMTHGYMKKLGEKSGFEHAESFVGPLSYTINLRRPQTVAA